MTKDVATINTGAFTFKATQTMTEDKRGYLIVLQKGQPYGIVTEKDLVRKVMAKGADPV
ncbi:MAG: hypothetical protein QG670_2082 [Thermoproteota archaeon]|nr:hypothetical protein [Thermoproteota archaeon]